MDRVPAMTLALEASFGSVERWQADFVNRAAGSAGTGGAVLAFSQADARLVNRSEVAGGVLPAGFESLLRIEDRPSGGAFLAGIDWADVYTRYRHAVERASEGYGVAHEDLAGALVLDVRRRAMFEEAATRLPGAAWRDPAGVAAWSAEIPADRPVVVYCIYGHEVGQATALRLRAAGVDARFLRGGIDGWQAAGRALERKEIAS
ncbi:MAG: rhodanese-like domain-containing protein [Caldimonas sp.]